MLVGSTQRASAICLKPSSPPTASPSPRRSYAPDSASHNRAQRLESTTAPATQAPAPRDSRSRAACPDSAVILSRPARTRTASSASSWAEPRCSTIRRTPCSLATICTAVAPEAVRTFRTNGLTPPPYNHPLVPRTHHPDRTTPTKNPHHDATSPKLARVRPEPPGGGASQLLRPRGRRRLDRLDSGEHPGHGLRDRAELPGEGGESLDPRGRLVNIGHLQGGAQPGQGRPQLR